MVRNLHEPGLGQVEHLGNAFPPADPHPPAQRDQLNQGLLQAVDVAQGVFDRATVGRKSQGRPGDGVGAAAHHLPAERIPQGLDGLQGEEGAGHVSIGVFHGVELVEPAPFRHQVSAESHQPSVDFGQQSHRALGVPLGREHVEAVAAPGKFLVVVQGGGDRQIPGRREEIVAVVVVVVDPAGLPEQLGFLEQVAFVLRDRQPGPRLDQLGVTPALVPVVMGVQDPLHLPATDFRQGFQHGSGAGVDQQRRLAVLDDVDVAGVGETVEMLGNSFNGGHARHTPWKSRSSRQGVGTARRIPSPLRATKVIQEWGRLLMPAQYTSYAIG